MKTTTNERKQMKLNKMSPINFGGQRKDKVMQELICKNCEHSETLEKINGSAITKILKYKVMKNENW